MTLQVLLKELGGVTTETELSNLGFDDYIRIETDLMKDQDGLGVILMDLEDGLYIAPYTDVLRYGGYERILLSEARQLRDGEHEYLRWTIATQVQNMIDWHSRL